MSHYHFRFFPFLRSPFVFPSFTIALLLAVFPVFVVTGSRLATAQPSRQEPSNVAPNAAPQPEADRLQDGMRMLETARRTGDRAAEITALITIGEAYLNQEQASQARESFDQAAAIARQLDRNQQVNTLLNIGADYVLYGNNLLLASNVQPALDAFQQALVFYQAALPIAQEQPLVPDLPDFSQQEAARFGLAQSYTGIGQAHSALKHYADAVSAFQQALNDAQQVDSQYDPVQQTQYLVWINLGSGYLNWGQQLAAAGQVQQSLSTLQQGLRYGQQGLTRAGRNSEWQQLALRVIDNLDHGIGQVYFDQAQYAQAIAFYQQELAIDRQLGNRADEAITLGAIAAAHGSLSEYQQALEVEQQALTIARELDNRSLETSSLIGIGKYYSDLGRYAEALEQYQQALAIAKQQNALSNQVLILNNLGNVYTSQGHYDEALQTYQQAFQLNQALRHRLEQSAVPSDLGQICNYGDLANQLSSAPAYLAEDAAEQMRNGCLELMQKAEATLFNGIGQVYHNQGRYSDAAENYQKALTIARTTHDRSREATVLYNMASVLLDQGEYPSAQTLFQQVLEIQTAIGDRAGQGQTLNSIGKVHTSLGQYQQALTYYQQALDIAQSLGIQTDEAVSLGSIGTTHLALADYPAALTFLQRSLDIRQKTGDRPGEITVLNNIASVYEAQGNYSQSLTVYQQALTLAQTIGDPASQATSFSNLSVVYSDQGNYSEAMKVAQQALVIRRQIGDRAGEMSTLNNIGYIHYLQGRYPQALEFYQQALTIAQLLKSPSNQATALNNIGTVYAVQNDAANAINYQQQALTLYRTIGDRNGAATSLTNLATSYSNQGDLGQALNLYQQALAIFQSTGGREGEINSRRNMGTLYTQLGQYAKALDNQNQALTLSQETGNRPQQISILNAIGFNERKQKRYAEALTWHQQALDLAQKMGDRSSEGYALASIGYSAAGQENHAQAAATFQQAVTIFREIGDRYGEGLALNGLGMAESGQGKTTAAIANLQQALTLYRQIHNPTGEAQVLNDLGIALFRAKQFAAAEKTLYEALPVLESLRSASVNRANDLSDTNKVSLFETQLNTYEVLQQTLIAQNKMDAALEVAERGRTRVFAELLSRRLTRDQTATVAQPAANDHSLASSAALPASATSAASPSIDQIRQIAKTENATLVEYSVLETPVADPVLYIWVVSSDGEIAFRSVDLKSFSTSLSDLVAFSRHAIGARGRGDTATVEIIPTADTIQQQHAQQQQTLHQLYQLLIQPIAELLPAQETERVVFIPQRQLFLVPFPALVDARGDYLIQHHTLSTAPSLQILDLTHQHQQTEIAGSLANLAPNQLLVVGNPAPMPTLPGQSEPLPDLQEAEAEATAIATDLHTQPILEGNATKAAVVQRMQSARIIHLATHGLLEYGDPNTTETPELPGAIALAATKEDNGLLTASDIQAMRLQANLVVLSACNTGQGDITGDGVIGLSRSFVSAGVPSVIVSLWSVDDQATSELMQAFYRFWQTPSQHLDKAQALRQAMLTTLKSHPDPYFWAAFTLIGASN